MPRGVALGGDVGQDEHQDHEEVAREFLDVVPGRHVDGEEETECRKGQQPAQGLPDTALQAESPRSGGPAADHQAGPEQGDVGRYARGVDLQFLLHQFRQVGGRGYLHADIQENGDHAHPQLGVGNDAPALADGLCRTVLGGPLDTHGPEDGGKGEEEDPEAQIGQLDRGDIQLAGGMAAEFAEDGQTNQQRADGGAHVVDRSGQAEPLGCGLGRAQGNGQRVGGGLLQGETQAHDEKSGQQEGEGGLVSCGNEEQGAQCGYDQPHGDAPAIPVLSDEVHPHAAGKPHVDQGPHRVGHIEHEGDHLALPLFQGKLLLEHGDQDVVAGGHEAPKEEYAGEHIQSVTAGERGGRFHQVRLVSDKGKGMTLSGRSLFPVLTLCILKQIVLNLPHDRASLRASLRAGRTASRSRRLLRGGGVPAQ